VENKLKNSRSKCFGLVCNKFPAIAWRY